MVARSVRRLLLLLVLLAVSSVPAAELEKPRLDPFGDPLPPGAWARLGTTRFRIANLIRNAALSPDGKLIAVLVEHNQVGLLDAATGKEVRRFQANLIGSGTLLFSPDGKQLAVTHLRGVQLLDTETGALAGRIDRNATGLAVPLAFSGDGKFLALGTEYSREQPAATVWDVRANKVAGTFPTIHNHHVRVALSPDGKWLATWGQALNQVGNQNLAQVIQLWDVRTGKEQQRLQVESRLVAGAVAFAPDGKQLAVAEGTATLAIWDLASGKPLRRSAVRRNTQSLWYSPNGKLLAGGTTDGSVQVWEADTGKRLAFSRREGQLCSLTFPAPNRVLGMWNNGSALCVREVPDRAERSLPPAHTGTVTGLVFSRDGKELSSAGSDGIRVWETATGNALRHQVVRPADERERFSGMTGPSIDLAPNGKYVVCGMPHLPALQVQELATGETLFEIDQNMFGQQGTGRMFSADGMTLATLSVILAGNQRQQVVRIWDLATGQQKRSFETALGQLGNSLALSPDGRLVATATADFNRAGNAGWTAEVNLWDVATGKQLGKLNPPGAQVTAMTFSPDGSLLATSSQGDPAIHLWDPASGTALRELESENNQGISCLLFSPDGRTLAAGLSLHNGQTLAGRVLLLETVSGKVKRTFTGHQRAISSLAFALDGRALASGSYDTTVLLWDLLGQPDGRAGPRGQLTAEELDALWKDLDNADAQKAYQAMIRLVAGPREALTLLDRQLTPAPGKALTEREIDLLLVDLDSDTFETREKASEALAGAGKQVRPALVKALEEMPSLEKKRRLEELLEVLAQTRPTPEMIRPTRALEVLERLGTPKAQELLQKLASGFAEARLTVEARETLRRLQRLAQP